MLLDETPDDNDKILVDSESPSYGSRNPNEDGDEDGKEGTAKPSRQTAGSTWSVKSR